MKKLILSVALVAFSAMLFSQSNVTFQVDMNQYSGTFTTPEVNGTFNGWCGNCNAMSDANSDGIWDVTVSIAADSIEFKFAHDNWSGQESLTPGSACTKTTSGFTNRFIYINGDTTLPVVCWESCNACGQAPDTSFVTFRVDMNQYSGTFTTPEVNGTFNGWCGNCNAMTDANSDGVWEITLPITSDSIEYKFAHDNWTGQEELTEGSACTKTTGGFTNRFRTINGDIVLPVVCWESCDACLSNVTFQVDMNLYTETFTTPEVNGTFNGWCGNCSAMSDADGDNVWDVTLALSNGTYEFKYSHDNWTGQEELTDGDTCTLTTGSFVNRLIVVSGDTTLNPVCWESCSACPDSGLSVTDIVDVQEITLYPNPAQNTISLNSEILGSGKILGTIYNSSGQMISLFSGSNSELGQIDVSGLENGLYILKLNAENKQSMAKFIIEK